MYTHFNTRSEIQTVTWNTISNYRQNHVLKQKNSATTEWRKNNHKFSFQFKVYFEPSVKLQ